MIRVYAKLLAAPLAAMFLSAASTADERPIRIIPALNKAIALDGNLKKLAPATEIQAESAAAKGSGLSARVAYWRDVLYLGIDVTGDKAAAAELAEVEIHFPGAGATARGYTYRFAPDGKRAADPETGPPALANSWVQSTTRRTDHGWVLEARFPAKSLPRFPAKDPLLLELCVTYQRRTQVAGTVAAVSNCEGGSMRGEMLRLPDDFRRALKLDLPKDVAALEGREHGWVGFALLHYPVWMISDRPMTSELLRTFFLEQVHDPVAARISLPARMHLPNGRQLAAILTGSDPFLEGGGCNPENELKMGIYVLQGRTARNVLEWPAASCKLGRASSVVVDNEGALSVAYAGGATVNFIWSGDHFERTEIG